VRTYEPHDRDVVRATTTASPFDSGGTRVYEPRHVTPRIRAQAGLFTVHKPRSKSQSFIALEKNRRQSPKLKKIEVPASAFKNLRFDLDRCGVNEASLFPDLDGLASTVGWRHQFLHDEQ